MKLRRKYLLLLGLGLYLCLQAGGICWSQTTERVSVDTTGSDGDSASNNPSTSSDGRYVAFESGATDLVVGGSNGLIHIFVRDRQTGKTTQVSLHTDGTEGDRDSGDPSISGDGRYVAFESGAGSLADVDIMPFPPFGFPDIFVRDRDADGNGIYDEAAGVSTVQVSVDSTGTTGDGPSLDPSISADGRYVAFDSDATILVPGGSDGSIHIFVHDRDADGDGIYDNEDGSYDPGEVSTAQVSVDSAGTEGDFGSSAPSISASGRYVAFESSATNLVPGGSDGSIHIFVHDRDADGDGIYDNEDGSYDPGEVSTVQVSVDSAGTEGNAGSRVPSISADGRYVAFESDATNLVGVGNDTNASADVFVHDLQTGTTTRVSVDSAGSEGDLGSSAPSISADGRYVAFQSDATKLVANDNNASADIFVHDLQLGTTRRVGVTSNGDEATGGGSSSPSYSADGQYVAFESLATNLVVGDANGVSDVFIRESMPPTVTSTGPTDSTTDVAVDADINATFSEEMDGSTINGTTFTLDNGATGTVSYDAISTTATFTPTINLNYDTTYTATITTGAQDLAGNSLQADYSWSFTTGPAPDTIPPAVNDTNPVDSATDLAVDAGITATFSEAMQASTVNATTFTLDNGVTGTVSYDTNSTMATFTPTSNLNHDTTYTATITTDAEDVAGNGLQANHSWSFATQSEGNSGGDGRCFIGTAADGFGW